MTIFETLKMIGVTSEETREVFSKNTRDVDPLTVYRDSLSGVIFIDDFYTGVETYTEGAYRPDNYSDSLEASRESE